MRTRGKRVTAEAVIPRAVLREHLRVEPESLQEHGGVANVGAFLSGANNNGLHSPNAITAMFIATGQDVANVAEGSAALVYTEMTPTGTSTSRSRSRRSSWRPTAAAPGWRPSGSASSCWAAAAKGR